MNRYELTVEEHSITYTDDGVGDPVVFIHGFTGSADYWKYVLPELAKKHRVLAVNLKGHGGSSTAKEEYGVEEMAEDIKLVLDDLDIQTASVFGHSLGGYVTLAFAEKYPDRLNSFGLIHSTGFPDDEEGKLAREAAIRKIETEGIHGFIDQLVPKLFAPENGKAEEEDFTKQIGYHTPPAGATAALQAMKVRPDRRAVIDASHVPVLLLAGEKDQVVPPEKTFTSEAPHIHSAVLSDSGHMGMLEQPEEFNHILINFLENIVHPSPQE
ncbi:alpha/beta fold hydrolase [Bacillus mangrovi]|uniref:Alpha/beta fold hydrolase n=1 Tax=Metabacillus mangrovi TaxID=1491830 RepID=A0A7X2S2L1_9BACI|nr:alpha/beta hydrolase [Metabacillus mangrovi]MTH52061.1 alpha/beta fold hydrolase [Metabacillus mangrovi]